MSIILWLLFTSAYYTLNKSVVNKSDVGGSRSVEALAFVGVVSETIKEMVID